MLSAWKHNCVGGEMTLSKEQIEAIQAWAKKAMNSDCIDITKNHVPALCQQALRAIELESELAAMSAQNAALSQRVSEFVTLLDHQFGTPCEQIRHQQEVEDLQRKFTTQKAAHSKLLRDEADRCAKHSLPESYKFLRRLADKIEKEE